MELSRISPFIQMITILFFLVKYFLGTQKFSGTNGPVVQYFFHPCKMFIFSKIINIRRSLFISSHRVKDVTFRDMTKLSMTLDEKTSPRLATATESILNDGTSRNGGSDRVRFKAILNNTTRKFGKLKAARKLTL